MPNVTKSKTDADGNVREVINNGGSYTVRLRTKGDVYSPSTVLAQRDVPTEQVATAIMQTLGTDKDTPPVVQPSLKKPPAPDPSTVRRWRTRKKKE